MLFDNWAERSDRVFAQGCSTYSKRRDQYIEGIYPTHCDGAEGAEILSGGKRFVDFVGGLGSNLIDISNNYTLPVTDEVVLGERIKALFPCIDKLKIVKTGSAACSAAVRIARTFTGRNDIYGTGYHGTDDWTISAENPGSGTLGKAQCYIKFNSFKELISDLRLSGPNPAAVIIEPVQLSLDVHEDLKEIRRLCTDKGIVLIFDEVITGFRFLNYSVANHWDIQPDIICLGKALGNGYPIAIVGGREDIMQATGYFISNTHNGEASAIHEALKTLDYLTPGKLSDLWERGDHLNREFNRLSPHIKMVGYPTRSELHGDEMFKGLFMQEMCKRGYLFGRARFLTFSHTKDVIEKTLSVSREVVQSIDSGSIKLEGELPKPVFKRN